MREFDCLQLVIQIFNVYDRHSAKFPFKKTFICLLRHFHSSSINFKLKCVLFRVNKIQFYEGHFRINRVNESTIPRIIVDRCLNVWANIFTH